MIFHLICVTGLQLNRFLRGNGGYSSDDLEIDDLPCAGQSMNLDLATAAGVKLNEDIGVRILHQSRFLEVLRVCLHLQSILSFPDPHNTFSRNL